MSYLAPEIVAGGRPVPASDQFACGSVLWEALVGRKLFDGATDYETYCRLRDCMVQPLRPLRPDVPAPFAQIIHRALSPSVDTRFPSAREMARQIGTALKKVQLRKDLHTVLARSVGDARTALGLGQRTEAPSEATPIADAGTRRGRGAGAGAARRRALRQLARPDGQRRAGTSPLPAVLR